MIFLCMAGSSYPRASMLPSTENLYCPESYSLCGLDSLGVLLPEHAIPFRLPKGAKTVIPQLALVPGSIVIFLLQVKLMDHITAGDAYGGYFFYFVVEGIRW